MSVLKISKQCCCLSVWVLSQTRVKNKRKGIFGIAVLHSVFRSSDYLSTLLRIAQTSKKPPSFFSWSEPAGGLYCYPTQSWPKNGFTMFGWIRFENYPSDSADLPMLIC